MALEKVLLTSHANGAAPNTLHLLEFSPSVLLGYSQTAQEEIEEGYCLQNGIQINRRISGGGCIYVDGGTLGWELIAKKNTPKIPQNLEAMYKALCGGLVLALSKFGISAEYRPLNDVEAGGRKISGTGGTELGDSFIFHGTVLVDFDVDVMVNALKVPFKKRRGKPLSETGVRTVCMRELLGYAPPIKQVKEQLASAFSERLDIEFEEGGLCAEEICSLKNEAEFFSSNDWIFGKHIRK